MENKIKTFEEMVSEEYGTPMVEEVKDSGETKKKSKKDDENVVYVSYLETEDYILEQIRNATHATAATHATDTQFIQYHKKSGSISFIDSFQDKALTEKIYKPIIDDLFSTGTVCLPSGIEEYGTTGELVEEITKFLYTYFELPKSQEKFMPYLVLFYWVYERFPFVPYLHFVGRTSTGKSTAMEVLGSICYKAIDASGAITMSSIFRVAHRWKGTLLLDEFNSGGENYHEMIAFLKSGVSNKSVLRVEGDKEREVRAYVIKSPKMFTSEDPINDAGLQSRTIVVKMEKNKRRIPLYRLKGYEESASKLRNKLLLWRLHNLNKINLTNIEFGFSELESFDRRVQQVITPIYYLSDTETKKKILDFAGIQQEETFRERREALPGQIFQIIADNYPNQSAITLITKEVNKERNAKMEYTEKKISNVVRKVLGFDIRRLGHENISTVILEEEKLKELALYYGIAISVASVAQVARVAEEDEFTQNMLQLTEEQ